MTFCPNCGASQAPNVPDCPRCGKKTGAAIPPPQFYQSYEPYQLPHQIYPGRPVPPAYPQYPAQPMVPANPVYQRPASSNMNTYAVLGFVLALLPLPFVGLVVCIMGLIQCGQAGPDGRRQKGRGLAVAGIVIRVLGVVLVVIAVAAAVWYFADTGYYLQDYWDEGFAFAALGRG